MFEPIRTITATLSGTALMPLETPHAQATPAEISAFINPM